MGPFGRFTSKLKGQQKETCKDGKQCSDAGAALHLNDHVPTTLKRQELVESLEQKGSPKELSRAPEKGTRGSEDESAAARHETAIGKVERSAAKDSKLKTRIWRDSKLSLYIQKPFEVLVTVPSPGKTDERELEVEGASKSGVSVMETTQVMVAAESSDLETSTLTRSLGLNRIKTRSGPLCENAVEGEKEVRGGGCKYLKGEKAQSSAGNSDKGQCQGFGSEALVFKELDDVDRSKPDHMASKHDEEHGRTSTEVLYHDLESASRSLQGKHRLKSKADLQRPQNGRSGLDDVVRIGQAVTCSLPVASTASQSLESVHTGSKEFSKVPSKTDNMLEKKVPSRLSSHLDNECDKSYEAEAALKQLDVIGETESPEFHSIPQIPEFHRSKKWPKDIKSFSHELGPRGGRAPDVSRPHSDNDLEELLADLRGRFNTAKEEVDAELNLFAADLVEILDRNAHPFPQWQEKVEDLLVLARRCTLLSSYEFRRECENIVHELDDRRQELPMGLLKQLHTRMLFILTRCTRLLQFQKETSPDEECFHKIQQCLKCVPSLERTVTSAFRKRGKTAITNRKLLSEVLEQTARSDVGLSDLKTVRHTREPRFAVGKAKLKNQQPCSPKISQVDPNRRTNSNKLSAVTSETFDSYHNLGTKGSVIKSYDNKAFTDANDIWDQQEGNKLDEDDVQPVTTTPWKLSQKTQWFSWTDAENFSEESDSVICRICEEEVRTSHLEPHSLRCTLADACDVQGLNTDERLRLLADTMEKIAGHNIFKSNQVTAEESPDAVKTLKLNLHDGFDSASPRSNELQGKIIDSRFDDVCVDGANLEELRGISLISFKRLLGSKSDQGVTSSSAGSGTPRSTLTTPRTSQLDLLWAERNSFAESEDISQIYELAGVARCIANKGPMEDGALDSLEDWLEEVQEILRRNKIVALTVDTFGKRIEKLLREKLRLTSGAGDQRKLYSTGSLFEDDGTSTDDGAQSLKSTPTHPSCNDRITIEDFDILKLISRGAFGRVFLARKRATGDLFAIKVLRKIDMIRKNAVENILAERDILISVRNPFVVRFFYSFTCRDNLYLVMEYLNGGDLYSLLRNMGCLDEHVARVYIAELVLALEYLHSLGVVHRDLKPDNILIARDGHIKLTDFGLSKVGLINSTDDLSGPSANGGALLMEEAIFEGSVEHVMQRERRKERSAVGTPDYLAPEILLGTEHGYTADWWSVGIILFECLTGLPPFNAEHPQIIFDNILNRKIPWPHLPEDMSYEAKDLIDKLLTEDPNQRLGAKGAAEVKGHPFFKDISWDTLARQKAAFVPSPESMDDTSYFTSRHLEGYTHSSPQFADSSDCSTSCSSTNSLKAILNEGEDECGDLVDFGSSPSVEHTFNNFSFKNLSQLASINYDLLSQTGKDPSKGHSRHQSAS